MKQTIIWMCIVALGCIGGRFVGDYVIRSFEMNRLDAMVNCITWTQPRIENGIDLEKQYYYCIKILKQELEFTKYNKNQFFKITDRDVTNVVKKYIGGVE